MNNNQVTIDGQSGTIGADGMVRMGSDDQMNVLFYKKPVLDVQKSRELGRPWHRSMDYVRIQQPGEKDYNDRPVQELDDAKYRWPRLWDAYQKGQEPAPNGTPVDVLFPQNPEIPANLHTLGVHTIEQLSGLTEHGAQTVGMGSTMWRNKAKEFLAAANGGAGMHRLNAENDRLKNSIEVLSNQNAALKAQLDRLSAIVEQKIPQGTVPDYTPRAAPTTLMSFSNDAEDVADVSVEGEFTSGIQTGASGQPLFIEAGEDNESDEPTDEEIQNSKPKPGWPKGKPRGPRTSQEG